VIKLDTNGKSWISEISKCAGIAVLINRHYCHLRQIHVSGTFGNV